MKITNKEKYIILINIIISCVIMALVETVMEPTYVVKSAIKVIVFLLLPLVFMRTLNIKVFDKSFAIDKKRVIKLLLLGAVIYLIVFGSYLISGKFFDYSSLVSSLSADQKVDSGSFIWIALYISFCNSFLEEFLFRFVSFIKLSEYSSKRTAYIFSSIMFALYHIGIIGTSFPLPLLILALIGLALGGCVFDYVDDKSNNIYSSWMIHMFADFALMTIWYIHI